MTSLEDFKDEISAFFSEALLVLSAEDYEALCDYTKLAMEGQI